MEPTPQVLPCLTLLGEFELTFAGEPLQLSGPAQRLTAYLAVVHRNRAVRRAALAERLWPDAPPGRASSSLRSVLWRLPRPRGRAMVVSNATDVWLAPELRVDLWEAEEQAHLLCADDVPERDRHTDLSLLRHALRREWDEGWLVSERESYRQKRLHALERSAR